MKKPCSTKLTQDLWRVWAMRQQNELKVIRRYKGRVDIPRMMRFEMELYRAVNDDIQQGKNS